MKSYILVFLSIALQGCASARASDMNDLGMSMTIRSIRSDVQDVHARPDVKFIEENYSFFYQVDASGKDALAYASLMRLRSTLLEGKHAGDRAELEYFPIATIELSEKDGKRKFVTDGCYAQDLATRDVMVLGGNWKNLIGTLSAPHDPGPVECP